MNNLDSPLAPSTPEYVSRRRTSAMAGCVRFPVEDPRFRSTREGGMFVKLVVVDDRDYQKSDWNICCGALVQDSLTESFIGDDQAPTPRLDIDPTAPPETLLAAMKAHDTAHREWEARHYPNLRDDDDARRENSRPYVAAMLLGITGWSGFDEEAERYWQCSFDDLTLEGQALYRSLQALYPGCVLHLLTFLDT